MPAAEVLVGAAGAVLVGRSALPRGRGLSASALAEDFALGVSIVVPLALGWGLAGLPWSAVAMPALALGTAVAFRLATPRDRRIAVIHESSGAAAPLDRAAQVLLVLCALLAAWKWLRTPLWSWDHYAIWGLKARRIVVDGGLDLAFLNLRQYLTSNPDYPLGLPIAWRFLSPSEPSAADFRLTHALFAAVLVVSTHAAARRLGASRAVAALFSAALCASPLFWDTEAVGVADLPLASVAVATLLLALEARDDPSFPAWPAGLLLGFLAWIKLEGLPLGVFLAVACAVGLPGKKRLALLAPWILAVAAALATRRWFLPPGVGFLDGDWSGRLAARARSPGPILAAMLRELAGPEWLGIWFLFAAAAVGSFLVAARFARRLSAAVIAQLGAYAFVYFGTFLDPAKHLEASFHRLAAALVPLALLVAAALWGALQRGCVGRRADVGVSGAGVPRRR